MMESYCKHNVPYSRWCRDCDHDSERVRLAREGAQVMREELKGAFGAGAVGVRSVADPAGGLVAVDVGDKTVWLTRFATAGLIEALQAAYASLSQDKESK